VFTPAQLGHRRTPRGRAGPTPCKKARDHTKIRRSGWTRGARGCHPGVPTTRLARYRAASPADNFAAGRELLARTDPLVADVLRRLRARFDLPPPPRRRRAHQMAGRSAGASARQGFPEPPTGPVRPT
jgi:hypothetical protein